MRRAHPFGIVLLLLGAALPAAAGEGPCDDDPMVCVRTMVEHIRQRGWVGIELDVDEETGVKTVRRVIADSPAEAAGMLAGDVLVALNGVAYGPESSEALERIYRAMRPGATVTYTVARAGAQRELRIELGRVPEPIMAQWVGQHVLQHLAEERKARGEAETAAKEKP